MVFFSQDNIFAGILFLTTFFNPVAGLAGLASVIFSIILLKYTGFDQQIIKSGIYSFNSLLLALGLATFFECGPNLVVWLIIAIIINCFFTVIFYHHIGRYQLPVLSIPFILTYWLLVLSAHHFPGIGLTGRQYQLKELSFYSRFTEDYPVPAKIDLFLRALSSIVFQNSRFTGFLISIGILIHSRIAFSLLLIGFFVAVTFNSLTGVFPLGISYYYLGANLMMVALATGSFFLIPSWRAYVWAVVAIMITFLFITAFSFSGLTFQFPLLSFPFSIVSLLVLRFLKLRNLPAKPALVFFQHYSPETNLYTYLSFQKRLKNLNFFRLILPFLGKWAVSQGYNGAVTHNGGWAQALDFVITDDEHKTYRQPGALPEHFYCFGKPVLAVADGLVAAVEQSVEDNAIGAENLTQNWGNAVVIKHADGLFSKVAHLQKNSVKVKVGQQVKQGDVIGLCGNSGRSPEPHLHFQMQETPFIGSKTVRYPFGFVKSHHLKQSIKTFEIPAEGEEVWQPETINLIKNTFNFKQGDLLKVSLAKAETKYWEVMTDFNQQYYLYCKSSGSAAYFVNDGGSLYFTTFYGDKNSTLYHFFLAAFRVVFSTTLVEDEFPLYLKSQGIVSWMQDFVSPITRFIKLQYQASVEKSAQGVIIKSTGLRQIAQHKNIFFNAEIRIDQPKKMLLKFRNAQLKQEISCCIDFVY